MADYKSAFTTSLGDYCAAKDIIPSELEIGVIFAEGISNGWSHRAAFTEAVERFDRDAAQYEAVVDLRENRVSQKQTGLNMLLGLHDSTYIIRGTGISHKK